MMYRLPYLQSLEIGRSPISQQLVKPINRRRRAPYETDIFGIAASYLMCLGLAHYCISSSLLLRLSIFKLAPFATVQLWIFGLIL